MDNIKFDKLEQKKIWKAMIEAGVIEDKPDDKVLAKKQYNLKTRLKNTNDTQTKLIMKTLLFFYDKYHSIRKIFQDKLNNKEKHIKELKKDIEKLQRQNASLLSNENYYKDLLNESRDEADKYKRANKKLQNEADQSCKAAPDKIDFYGPAISCIVKGPSEAGQSDSDED